MLRGFALTFCLSQFAAAFGEARTLTVQEAVKLALEQAPRIHSAKANRDIASLEFKNSWSKFLPSLDLSSTFSATEQKPASGDNVLGSSASLALTENFYDNGATVTNFHIAKANSGIGNFQSDIDRDRLIYDVVKAMYEYSLLRKSLELRKEQQTNIEKQLAVIRARYRQGLQTRRDYIRARAQLQRSVITITNLSESVDTQLFQLRALVGLPASDSTDFAFMATTEISGSPRIVDVTQTRQFKVYELQREVNELKTDLVERDYWPRVNLTGSVTYTFDDFHRGGPFYKDLSSDTKGGTLVGTAGITLSYNLWDWGIRKRDWEKAHAQEILNNSVVRKNQLELESTLHSLRQKLQRYWKDYQLSKDLLSMDKESYDTMDADFRQGRVAYLDLITALNDLSDSQINFYEAYYNLRGTLDEIAFYEGKIYENYVK
jgi:outer membrane protein TolC